MRRRDRFSISSIRLADLGSPLSAIGRSKLLRCLCYDVRFVIAPLGQDRPRDARQLVSERGCQNIVMQPLRRGRKPRSKAMSCPICRSEQDHPGALHEQCTEIAISALADVPKDRPITGRHLLRHEAEPGVPEVVLVTLTEWLGIGRRYLSHLITKRDALAANNSTRT